METGIEPQTLSMSCFSVIVSNFVACCVRSVASGRVEFPQEEEENGNLQPHSQEEVACPEATIGPGNV